MVQVSKPYHFMKTPSQILILALSLSSTVYATNLEPLRQAFEKRLKLRTTSESTNEVILKNNIDSLRDKEELLGEKAVQYKNSAVDAKSPKAFSTPYLLNSKFSNLSFKSGDVIILRGTSALSALVSNITDTPSSYSHAVMVYIDGNNRRWGIEALVGRGVVVQKLDDILSEGVPRVIVYRYHYSKIATQAGRAAFQLAQPDSQGKIIPYDTQLNLTDDSAVYCSEMIRVIFSRATQGNLLLPTFPSTIGGKFPGIRKALALQFQKFSVFSPLDIDLESHFDLVAEWRDFNATVNYRIKDQLIKTVLAWLETQKDNIRNIKQLKDSQQNSEESTTSGDDNTAKILDGINTLLTLETTFFAEANQQFLIKKKRNMTTLEIQDVIDKSQFLDHAKIIFLQNELLKK